MLRRFRLAGKLAIAALPLVALLVAAATLFALEAIEDADREEFTAELAATWIPLQGVIDAFASEEAATLAALEELADRDLSAIRGAADIGVSRGDTDAAVDELRRHIADLGDPAPLVDQLEVAELAVGAVRAFFDESGTSPTTQRVRIPEGYDLADAQILQIGDLVVADVPHVELARDLVGVAAVSRALQAASIQDRTVASIDGDERLTTNLETIRRSGVDVSQWLASYESTLTGEAVEAYRASGLQQATFDAARIAGEIVRSGEDAPDTVDSDWNEVSEARRTALLDFQRARIDLVVAEARRAAADVRQEALIVLGAAALAVVVAAATTTLVSRSVVSRVRKITETARDVSQTQLPALVEALRDPSGDATLPTIPPIRDRGADEIGDLARSFSAMQSTLEHVASQQVEVLRRGVADMFVTLARRNRSLIDRQLAMIDTLERNEENPNRLADFYELDHLATRMRRNAESLLVLAGSESQKKWRTPLDVDDVVRAALGEVQDYRRIDVLALEAVRFRGTVVSDLAHLLSELLENATSFSPPQTRVRIAGHFHDEGYLLTITDRGVGIASRRLTELNELLGKPPVVGLALEPTLGLYVVAMLAKRHGVKVRLVTGAPGLTAHVIVPKTLFEVAEVPPLHHPSSHANASTPQREETHRRPTVEARERVRNSPQRVSESGADSLERRASQPEKSEPLPTTVASRDDSKETNEHRVTDGELSPSGLPIRKPGASFTDPEIAERSVETSARNPEELRTAFSSFQLGVTVGRDTNREGAHHE